MAKYILILHEAPDLFENHSPQEMQNIVQEYIDWAAQLREKGIFENGYQLEPDGKILSTKNNQIVVDGPFTESKEIVGGVFVIQANDEGAATEISKQCPHLKFGGRVEIRKIIEA